MISDIGRGHRDARSRDLPDCACECFLSRFAGAESEMLDASLEPPWFGDDL